MPGVAFHQPGENHPRSFEQRKPLQSLTGIFRAGGMEAARGTQQGRNPSLVEANRCFKNPVQHDLKILEEKSEVITGFKGYSIGRPEVFVSVFVPRWHKAG